MTEEENLRSLVLAPYLIKATALIGTARHIGGNQFRHAFATLGILLDYKYFSNSVLLKASLIHDLFEDIPSTDKSIIRNLDKDGEKVTQLVLEVTKDSQESKSIFLKRILEKGSINAKTLKAADRISNLTDINRNIYSIQTIAKYLDETEQFVVPMAQQVNSNMVTELIDLIKNRRLMISSHL